MNSTLLMQPSTDTVEPNIEAITRSLPFMATYRLPTLILICSALQNATPRHPSMRTALLPDISILQSDKDAGKGKSNNPLRPLSRLLFNL